MWPILYLGKKKSLRSSKDPNVILNFKLNMKIRSEQIRIILSWIMRNRRVKCNSPGKIWIGVLFYYHMVQLLRLLRSGSCSRRSTDDDLMKQKRCVWKRTQPVCIYVAFWSFPIAKKSSFTWYRNQGYKRHTIFICSSLFPCFASW